MYRIMIARPPLGVRLALVSYDPDDDLRDWMQASRFTDNPAADSWDRTPPLPIPARIEPGQAGAMRDLIPVPLPLMSSRLKEALTNAGVDNVDFYPAEIADLKSGTVIKDFVAFNIVGKISAADLAKTQFSPGSDARMISADIDSLSVDEARGGGALLFRLAESVNAIVVHERVQKSVESAGIDGVAFVEPSEWAG
jgi:hypothetical protein